MSNSIYTSPKICKHCNKTDIELNINHNSKLFSNHVRWCNNTHERGTDKFISRCSCILCKKETTAQSLSQHLAKHDKQKIVKSFCLQCNGPIYNNENKFCNQSCAAKYNNVRKDYTTFKSGPNPGQYKKPPYTKISWCTICNKPHTRQGKTCSDDCYKQQLSYSIKLAIQNGHNPNDNRGRGKRSYMEISFDKWLKDNYPLLQYNIEHPFKRLDMIKTYFVDFYFPSLSLIIELDGSQHKNTIEYDTERDNYIMTIYDVNIIRVSHKEYQNQSKIELIRSLLGLAR